MSYRGSFEKNCTRFFIFYVLLSLSGCVAATVVSAAVSVTTTVVGGAVDVVDAVTPDIIDDEE